MATTGPDRPAGGGALATERLVLRPVAEGDFAEIATLAGDARVAEWTARIPHPLERDDTVAWHGTLNRRGCGAGEYAFAVRLKADDTLIGCIGLTVADDERNAEIGYWIGVPFWDNGYATEAVRRMVMFVFGALRLARIEAPVFAGNARSARVLEKAGFEARGHAKLDAPARGKAVDAVLYRMERADFARVALSQAVGRA